MTNFDLMISRRGFIGMMVGGIAAEAAVRTFPFRVYSFPTGIRSCYLTRLTPAVLNEFTNYAWSQAWHLPFAVSLAGFSDSKNNGIFRITEGGLIKSK